MRADSDARAAQLVGLLAALVFVVLAVLVMTPLGTAFDGDVLGAVQQTATPSVVAAMGLLTRLGNEFIIVALPLVLLWLWRRRLRQQAVAVLIATLGAQLLNDALKLVFHRPRPSGFVSVIPGQAFSFPSGHAMVSIAFYGARGDRAPMGAAWPGHGALRARRYRRRQCDCSRHRRQLSSGPASVCPDRTHRHDQQASRGHGGGGHPGARETGRRAAYYYSVSLERL
jgi:PAP2 superfamily